MATRQLNSDKWSSAAGGEFNSQSEAQAHENLHKQSSSGPSFADGALGALWKIFCLIPHLIGLAVGAICGALLKAGVVGRVVLTALVAFAALIIMAMVQSALGFDEGVMNIVFGIVIWLIAIATGAWFWLCHYYVARRMDYKDFITLTKLCALIVFWGSIGVYLVGLIFRLNLGFGWAMGMTFLVAVAVWILRTRALASEVE